MREANLRRARIDLPRYTLHFDRIRMKVRLETEQLPILTDQDVDIIGLQFDRGMPDSKGGTRKEGGFGSVRRLVAKEVHFHDRA